MFKVGDIVECKGYIGIVIYTYETDFYGKVYSCLFGTNRCLYFEYELKPISS